LLELLEHLCGHEEKPREVYEWVLNWVAYPIQHPGAKMKTALVLHGPQGVGKNLFFESVMAIYGRYGRIVDQMAIEDKFNDWASRKLFLIADEVVARQELYHVKNKLKGFITSDWIRINPKNIGAYEERNHVNVVFLSNETQPLVLERDDRRYTVIWTPPVLGEKFILDVVDEIRNGGIAALHHYLKFDVKLDGFNEHTKPPMTRSKAELVDLSMDSTERFARDWIGGHIDGVAAVPVKSQDLYAFYRDWCGRAGYPRYAPEPKFLAEVTKRSGIRKALARYIDGAGIKVARFCFPPGVEQPVEKQQAPWLSECVEQFRSAVRDWKEENGRM
jgi:putative DNA primase/helicase